MYKNEILSEKVFKIQSTVPQLIQLKLFTYFHGFKWEFN